MNYLFRAPEVISGFHANLNLIVSPISADVTLRQWLVSGTKYLERIAPGSYRIRRRGLTNTAPASHSSGVSAT